MFFYSFYKRFLNEDVILAADVVYFEEQDPLVDALKESEIFSARVDDREGEARRRPGSANFQLKGFMRRLSF